mmetsp:Transcript_10763/g.39534  ORF Transcript_10763/g.39534 Transcript_10763/m.39534 type:complete len:244 (+) Transcript_10763:351-1082(+)
MTSRRCPLNTCISCMVRMSYTLSSWSRAAVSSQLPFWFHLTDMTVFLCPWKVETSCPVRTSHSFTRLSLLPDASKAFWGCQSTVFTSHPWPLSVFSAWQRTKSQTLIVVSSEHVANLRSVTAKVTSRMDSLWAVGTALTLLRLEAQYLRQPESSPASSHLRLCDQRNVRTGWSCACRMVSKLNVRPFHSVNSPVCAPVSSRRPSGVHTSAQIGVRILLVDECTNLVAKLVAGRCAYACGRSRS